MQPVSLRLNSAKAAVSGIWLASALHQGWAFRFCGSSCLTKQR